MNIVVQKFGGTSVATEESRDKVYEKIEKRIKENKKVVVVISAMGRLGAAYATDTLLNLLKNENPGTSERELDMVYSCGEIISACLMTAILQKKGHKAVCLTGQQAGIFTDDNFTDAKICKIDTNKIINLLNKGYVVVITGSQGITSDAEITTLGRGGSDITGCALGVALNADEIEIFSDVEGIMTGDPAKIEGVRLLEKITYDDCINMTTNSSTKVMHPRSIEVVKDKNIKLHIKSTFSDSVGTLVCAERGAGQDDAYVVGISDKVKGEKTIVSVVGKALRENQNIHFKALKILEERKIPILDMEVRDEVIKITVGNEHSLQTSKSLHNLVS